MSVFDRTNPPPGWRGLETSPKGKTGFWCRDCKDSVLALRVRDKDGRKWEVCDECFLASVKLENMTECIVKGPLIPFRHKDCGQQVITRELYDTPTGYCVECGVFVSEMNLELLEGKGTAPAPVLLLAAKSSAMEGLMEEVGDEDEV